MDVKSGKGVILVGTAVGQDFRRFKWPKKHAEVVFDMSRNGSQWVCTADGFGRFASYGNGQVFVNKADGVRLIGPRCPTCGK